MPLFSTSRIKRRKDALKAQRKKKNKLERQANSEKRQRKEAHRQRSLHIAKTRLWLRQSNKLIPATWLLLLLVPVQSRLDWQSPPIFQIEEEVFKKNVIDEYHSAASTSSTLVTHEPVLSNTDSNPYKGNITRFAVYDQNYIDPIPVFDKDGHKIKEVYEVYVECYESLDCAYELTSADRHELSLYASMIESSGDDRITAGYSLGLIRSKDTTNILGMFTQGFSVLSNNYGFWIRLEDASQKRIYTNLNVVSKTMALLDLSVHERSHFDEPTYETGKSHCDAFQANYNHLFQRASREITSYVALTAMHDAFSFTVELGLVILSSTLAVIIIVLWILLANA